MEVKNALKHDNVKHLHSQLQHFQDTSTRLWWRQWYDKKF